MKHTPFAALLLTALFASVAVSLACAGESLIDLSAVVDTDASLASPGDLRAPIAGGMAVADWAASPQNDRVPGRFLLQFKHPVQVGTVLVYAKAALSCLIDDAWHDVPYAGPEEHVLRYIPLPAGKMISALRLTLEPELITRGNDAGLYGTTVRFLALLQQRLANASAGAAVLTSSADALSQGFRPVVWLNRPWTLVDGFISDRSNFFSRRRGEDEPAISAESPEWIMLAWERPLPLRALLIARGSAEKGLGDAIIETYDGTGNPRFALGDEGWRKVEATLTQPMKFRSVQMLALPEPVTTRALRIRCVGGVEQLGVGEVSALVDAGAAPDLAGGNDGLKQIPFTIPGPGKVTIQVRDADGNVIANPVTGVEFPRGDNTAAWDLVDIDGNLVLAPGTYTWRGLHNPGLRVEYLFTYFPYPTASVAWQTPDRRGGWLADHEAPRTVVRHGANMWVGAFAEAGDSIIEVDTQMKKLWGEYRIWLAEPGWVCSDGGEYIYYIAEGGWIGDRQVIIQIHAQSKRSRRIFNKLLPDKQREDINGFQIMGTKAFVSASKPNLVYVYDLAKNLQGPWRGFGWKEVNEQFEDEKPQLITSIPLDKPGRIRPYGPKAVITTSGKDVVLIDTETYKVTPLFAGKLTNPMGLGVDDKMNVYVGEGEPLHQVLVFAPDGTLTKTLGKIGRREIGPFDPDNLDSPWGVDIDHLGRVWVCEHTDYPKRVSVWDMQTGKCVNHVFGPTQYGGGGCIDPADDSRLFYKGMEFSRDRATGKITPVNLTYRPDSKFFANFEDRNYPCYAFRAEGKLWFTSFMWPHGQSILVLWQYEGDRVQPVAAIGAIDNLRPFGPRTELAEGADLGEKKGESIDKRVNVNYGPHSPGAGVGGDNWSIRWGGRVIAPAKGAYSFYVISNDATRLWIDGKLRATTPRGTRESIGKGELELEAGSHPIVIDFRDLAGGAMIRLEWEGPGIERQVVAQDALRASDKDDAPNGLTRELFDRTAIALEWLIKGFPQRNEGENLFAWTDLNDNAFLDANEVVFGKVEKNGGVVTRCGVGWNWRMNEKFETATGVSGPNINGLVFFRPKARTDKGYPIFDLPREVHPGGGDAVMVDAKGNAICLTGPMMSVSPQGKINWRYINRWPGLHAGHRTTARGDEPGVLIAPCRFFGSATVNKTLGEVVAFNSNLGCTYLMTAADGLYIDRIFRDQRLGLLWRMPEPPTPDVLAETSLFDEHFGGTLQKCKGADGKDHLYYVVGKNHSSVVELTGLDNIRRLDGATLTVTPEDIAAAQLRRQQQLARQAEPKVYAIRKVKAGEITIDGRDAEWPRERIEDSRGNGGFSLAWDDDNLYVMFSGRDDRAVFENKGANPSELFKSGDVIDVMLQTQAGLDANRSTAGRGDIRLTFSMFEGKPICVLYDYDVAGIDKGQPFSSPWRTEWIDRVASIPEAKIEITRAGQSYCLEAAVPLAVIHLDPHRLATTTGDVGRVLSDQTGSAAAARVYWANKNTNIMSDLPSEAALQPNMWGMFVFQKE